MLRFNLHLAASLVQSASMRRPCGSALLRIFRSVRAELIHQTVDAIRAVTCETLGSIHRDLGLDSPLDQEMTRTQPTHQLLALPGSSAESVPGHGRTHSALKDAARNSVYEPSHSQSQARSSPWSTPRRTLEPSTKDRRTRHASQTLSPTVGGHIDPSIHTHYKQLESLSRVSQLGHDILARIFANLVAPFAPNDDNFRPGHMVDIIRASHVCRSWRAAALHARSLWTSLHTLSVNEMEYLDMLLSRSEPRPVQVLSLQFVTHRKLNFIKTCDALQKHLNRIVHLRIYLNSKQKTVFSAVKKAMTRSRASHLETFVLDFDNTATLRAESLFDKHAPRLREISIRPTQLGLFSDSILEGVTSVELLNDQHYLNTSAFRQICEKFPSLSHLTLPGPLVDLDGDQRDWAAPLLKSLIIRDSVGADAPRANPTLELLRHRAVSNINVLSPHFHTCRYILGKLDDPHELHVAYDGERNASIAVRAADSGLGGAYVRNFTRLDPADVTKLLEFIRFRNLHTVELALHASRPDWEDLYHALGTGAMDRVKVLTLFVAEVPSSRNVSTIDIFTYTRERRRRWNLRELSCLRFTSRPADSTHDVLGRSKGKSRCVTGDHRYAMWPCNTILAQDVLKFVREGLIVAVTERMRVELAGKARFAEGSTSSQVTALRASVGRVNVLSG